MREAFEIGGNVILGHGRSVRKIAAQNIRGRCRDDGRESIPCTGRKATIGYDQGNRARK